MSMRNHSTLTLPFCFCSEYDPIVLLTNNNRLCSHNIDPLTADTSIQLRTQEVQRVAGCSLAWELLPSFVMRMWEPLSLSSTYYERHVNRCNLNWEWNVVTHLFYCKEKHGVVSILFILSFWWRGINVSAWIFCNYIDLMSTWRRNYRPILVLWKKCELVSAQNLGQCSILGWVTLTSCSQNFWDGLCHLFPFGHLKF